MSEENAQQLAALQERISFLSKKLEQARLTVNSWTNASVNLSRSAAKARATTQSMGRGVGGILLGPKFRSSSRSIAVRHNAHISKELAEKRAKIAEGKRQAQGLVRQIQAELTSAKVRQRFLIAQDKIQGKTKTTTAKATLGSIDLLHKLKEAYDLGLLTEQCMSSEHLRQKPAFTKRHFPSLKLLYFHCLHLQILQASCL